MNLLELKRMADAAVQQAIECGESPDEIPVTLQIDGPTAGDSVYSAEEVELHYDNNMQASGCVLTAVLDI